MLKWLKDWLGSRKRFQNQENEGKEVKEMPNKVGQVFVCEICGNKVKMLVAGKGQLICCGQPMKGVEEK